ncbi:MAG TPA: hypothetical protein VGG03_27405 [Thermoanaerobaculia bacterium]|jgi:hypothetical protein
MNEMIEKKFDEMGARVRIRPLQPRDTRWSRDVVTGWPRLDVLRDRKGEYFDIAVPDDGSIEVVDFRPDDRHLLLLARTPKGEKAKFLCGHDERHWFVCAVPEREGVRDVMTAKRALQPESVREKVAEKRVTPERQLRRRNEAYTRQGEWFFVPADFEPPAGELLRNEPLSRGRGSKPHVVDLVYRRGGISVHVHGRHAPSGITEGAFRSLPEDVRKQPGWTRMVRDPEVYAKGRVRHPDHKTIVLEGWHRVFMNTEAQSRAAVNVVFLD